MRNFFAYTRVSTAKQGEQGVSLEVQREAISRYAERNRLPITEWFEERETAAKRGRLVFTRMMKLLRQGKGSGVVMHKIDRSARNLKDWADLGELVDQGIELHFANESLDLHSRGGRLSADIQAVVAADYIRNLREETRKGFYGRIKQGIYPLPAPIGYNDRGKGKVKEPDPIQGPLVRTAFELYATGRYGLKALRDEMRQRGLRNGRGNPITLSGLSFVLNNPFYVGLIRLRRTGETFSGAHEPLVPKSLFDRVQRVLRGKTNARLVMHGFLFRRLLKCATCGNSLIGERQKGHVYYRCHTRTCPTTSVREEAVQEALLGKLQLLRFNEREQIHLMDRLNLLEKNWTQERGNQQQTLELRLAQVRDRLSRLTDAFLDGAVEKELFEERKANLLYERKDLEETLERTKDQRANLPDTVREFLELAGSAHFLCESAIDDEKRDLLEIATSNRVVGGKNVDFTLSQPFRELENRAQNSNGAPYRDRPRTLTSLLDNLVKWFTEHMGTEEGYRISTFLKNNNGTRMGKDGEVAA